MSSMAALSVTGVLAMSYSGRHMVTSNLTRRIIRGHQLCLMEGARADHLCECNGFHDYVCVRRHLLLLFLTLFSSSPPSVSFLPLDGPLASPIFTIPSFQ